MSDMDSFTKKPNQKHFKLISEGGNHQDGSPTGATGCQGCQDSLWNVRECSTSEMKDVWRRSSEGCASTPSNDKFMFTLSLEHAPDLDRGVIPESMQHDFKKRGIEFAQTAKVTVMHVGKVWLITDGERRYSVRMLPTNLFVYTESS